MRGIKVIKDMRARERKRLIERALNKKVIPISSVGLNALKQNGSLDLETFKEHIGRIFPVILHRISEGKTYKDIADELGLERRTLITFLYDHARLKSACELARGLRQDKRELDRIEMQSILDT